MPGPSQAEVDAANAAYKAATADREAKQAQNETDREALDVAIAAETASHTAFLEALDKEHELEDAHEALVISHEPPPKP